MPLAQHCGQAVDFGLVCSLHRSDPRYDEGAWCDFCQRLMEPIMFCRLCELRPVRDVLMLRGVQEGVVQRGLHGSVG